jgi:hypothetical protein
VLETAGAYASSTADTARSYASTVADYAGDAGRSVVSQTSRLADQASNLADQAGSAIRSGAGSVMREQPLAAPIDLFLVGLLNNQGVKILLCCANDLSMG